MIQIDMLKSTDTNRLGVYHFEKNEISIGSKVSNDFIIDHKDSIPSIGNLIIGEEGNMYFDPISLESFKVNGKKTTAKKRIAVGDKIELLGNEFKIQNFKFIEVTPLNDYLSGKLEQLKQEKSPFIKVLKLLKE